MFDNQNLQTSIEKFLNQSKPVGIPNGATTALVIHGDTATGLVSAAIAKKIGKDWQVDGLFDWSHNSGFAAGFNVVYAR